MMFRNANLFTVWTVAAAGLCLFAPALHAKDASLQGFDGQTSFTSSKEKPGLDPVLSETIAEDIKKNIEARRLVEDVENRLRPREARQNSGSGAGDSNSYVLTTPRNAAGQGRKLGDNKQTSRIQIKKGPNGEDYEYEYVYYYYDDEDDDNTSSFKTSTKPEVEAPADSRGKNRYTTIDRNSAEAEADVGRQISSRIEEAPVEERLPQITRFPPRALTEATPTQVVEQEVKQQQQQQQKIRRPSLDLVDSHSFNTDDKLNKGGRASTEKESVGSVSARDAYEINAESGNHAVETTTSTMEKAAFDLYVILQNENLNRDLTTEQTFEASTVEGEEVAATDGSLTTTEEPVPSTTTTTTTTTTPRPTTTRRTTTTTTSTTTTTTTTTEAPVEARRGGSITAGRNRFKFRSQNLPSTSTTEAPALEANKSKNRFQRPTSGGYGGRGRSTAAPTAAAAPAEVTEEESPKPAPTSSFSGRPSRTRNRFNLRGQTTEKAIEAVEGNAIDTVSSTTVRAARPRPTFSIRPRGRNAVQTTAAPVSSDEPTEEKAEEEVKESTPVAPSVKSNAVLGGRPRLNAARPNPLLNLRSRSNILGRGASTTTTSAPEPAPEAAGEEDLQETDVPSENNEKAEEPEKQPAPEITTPATGLNRLKNRARLQVHKPEKPKVQPVAINRRANPLIARRNPFTSTTEAPVEEAPEESNEKTEDSSDEVEEVSEAAAEVPSEQPRGLGLLANRKRPLLRRPGTLTHQ